MDEKAKLMEGKVKLRDQQTFLLKLDTKKSSEGNVYVLIFIMYAY